MTNLVKIGQRFLNLDRVLFVEDRFRTEKEDAMVVRYGVEALDCLVFSGREADDLRTWLNSKAVNLRDATDLPTEGR